METALPPSVDRPSLCIVNFNGAAFLDATLPAALAERENVREILFVDNGSDDDSVEIASRYEGIRTIALGENRGASVVRNAAIREAASDRVLLIDSDVRLAPGCARALADALAADDRAAIAMARVLYESAPGTVQYDGADWHFLGHQIIEHRDTPDSDADEPVRCVGSVITACCIVDRRKVGDAPFDEDFFIYFEDHDVGVRSRLHGFDVLSVPSARCYHREGTPGLSIRALGEYSSRRVFYLIRNRWQFIAKNYSARSLLVLAPLLFFYEAVQLGVVVRKGWLRDWWRAVSWMGRHARDVLRRRRAIQAGRRRRDGELMKDGPIPFRPELTAGPLERWGRRWLDRVVSSYWALAGRWV